MPVPEAQAQLLHTAAGTEVTALGIAAGVGTSVLFVMVFVVHHRRTRALSALDASVDLLVTRERSRANAPDHHNGSDIGRRG